MTINRWAIIFSFGALWSVLGCSSVEVEPLPPLPKVPEYTTVPHPMGYQLVDIKAIFNHPDAPTMGDLEKCDEKLRVLKKKTNSFDERKRGVRELVASEPVFYHWCFYSRVLKLHDDIDSNESIQARQNMVVSAYETIAPLANAYRKEFQDTRYYRWAVKDYRKMSEAIFYRSLTLTPESSVLIVESMPSPHALWRKSPDQNRSILEKYGIKKRNKKTNNLDAWEDPDEVAEKQPMSAPTVNSNGRDLANDQEQANLKSGDDSFDDLSDIDLELEDIEGRDVANESDDEAELEDF